MAFFIQFPDDPDSHGSAGAKASVLARLTREGLPIPPWFVVASEAFYGNLARKQRDAINAAETPSALAAIVSQIKLSASFLDELDAAVQRLCPHEDPVVVRASLSAIDQDSYEAASSVQTQLYTMRPSVGDRIVEIWRAAYSENVLVHRRRHRLPLKPDPPAIIVQRLISPDASGAAFGSDLTTGQRTVSVVAAVFGLPTSMASGDCQPDLYRVDRVGKIVQRDIAKKNVSHRPSAEGPKGYVAREIPEAERGAQVLSNNEILKVNSLLFRVEQSFDCPQEIHWALEADALYLLDARPLTQLDRHADPDSPMDYLDSNGLAEMFPDTAAPLTISVVQRAAPHIARAFLGGIGLSDARINERSYGAHNLLRVVRARLYANLTSWYSLFAALPDYPFNARFYAKLVGWERGLPPKLERALGPGPVAKTAGFSTALAMYRGFRGVSSSVSAFHKNVHAALKDVPSALDRARLDELGEAYRSLEQRLLGRFGAPLLNEYYTMVVYGYLLQHVKALWPSEHPSALAGLLSRGGGKWLPPTIGKVQHLAMATAQDANTVSVFADGTLEDIYSALQSRPVLRAQCEEYIGRHGDLSFGGYKLEAEPLSDNPLPLFRAIAHAATSMGTEDDEAPVARDIPRREDVLAAPGIGPFQRRKLAWLTSHTRARLRDRDLITGDVGRVVACVRAIFREIGRRLYALGVLDRSADVFYLTVEEILGFIEGTVPTTDLAGLAHARRAHYEALAELPPPLTHLHIHLPPTVGNVLDQKPDTTHMERTGTGACPGFVRGRVLVAGTDNVTPVRGSVILVARQANVHWPLLYPGVDGILIEQAGPLSHAVLGYRDQRIPTVIGISHITTWLADGDLVDMDGASGVVRRVDDSDPIYAVAQRAQAAEPTKTAVEQQAAEVVEPPSAASNGSQADTIEAADQPPAPAERAEHTDESSDPTLA